MLTVIVRYVFKEDGKYYPQVFLDEYLYEIYMLEYYRIDISEGIDINKTNASKECYVCHYWYFSDFKYEPYLCNGCHDLMQKAMNFNDVAIVSVRRSNRNHLWYVYKDDAINTMKNSDLKKTGLLQFFFIIDKNELKNLL